MASEVERGSEEAARREVAMAATVAGEASSMGSCAKIDQQLDRF